MIDLLMIVVATAFAIGRYQIHQAQKEYLKVNDNIPV